MNKGTCEKVNFVSHLLSDSVNNVSDDIAFVFQLFTFFIKNRIKLF